MKETGGKKVRIAICDDDQRSRKELNNMLLGCGALLPDTHIFEFSSGTALVNAYQSDQRFDLIFMDIEMPGLSGFETGRTIRLEDKDVILVFLTNFPSFVFPSLQLEIFDYLVKPANSDDITQLMKRATSKYQETHYMIHLKWQDRLWAIEVNKVVYIEGYRRASALNRGLSSTASLLSLPPPSGYGK